MVADEDTIGALRVRLYDVERRLDRLDDQGSRGLVKVQAHVDELREDVRSLGAKDAAEKLARMDERILNLTEQVASLTRQVDSFKGRITAFGFTIAGGAVLFAITTAFAVFGH
jgi:hypothetical protein